MNLKSIKERAEKASEGPWEICTEDDVPIIGSESTIIVELSPNHFGCSVKPHNAIFIAHARTDVPDLVAEVGRLEKFIADNEIVLTSANADAENLLAYSKDLQASLTAANRRVSELEDLLENRCVPINTPTIVCLCGSTRFMDAFFDAGWKFTLQGMIVLSVGVCKHAKDHGGEALGQDVADKLDELHFRKIDLADFVYVLNVGGYIGKSTSKEIAYARSLSKNIEYLEDTPVTHILKGV